MHACIRLTLVVLLIAAGCGEDSRERGSGPQDNAVYDLSGIPAPGHYQSVVEVCSQLGSESPMPGARTENRLFVDTHLQRNSGGDGLTATHNISRARTTTVLPSGEQYVSDSDLPVESDDPRQQRGQEIVRSHASVTIQEPLGSDGSAGALKLTGDTRFIGFLARAHSASP